jgi:hypothetical protein
MVSELTVLLAKSLCMPTNIPSTTSSTSVSEFDNVLYAASNFSRSVRGFLAVCDDRPVSGDDAREAGGELLLPSVSLVWHLCDVALRTGCGAIEW